MTHTKEQLAILKTHGIPETAECLGWAVNLPESDEFLSLLEYNEESILKGWAATPELAMTFETEEEAEKAIELIEKGRTVLMFDAGDRIITLTNEQLH